MAREALGVVGAAVGYIYGGPTGAQWGYAIGSTIGGLVEGPTRVPHPGLAEAPAQTSRDGVPLAICMGLTGKIHGNILQKNPEEIVTTTTRQGKGGGTEVEEKTRYRTFAIGICEGPIAEVTRIWENNKLVYDNRASPAIPAAESAKYAEGFTIYKGDEAQLPDPELEAHWTTAETPAYRGLAYIVFNSKDLTDTGGAIPQFAFEVNGSSDATVTSKPYPIEALDGIDPTPLPTEYRVLDIPLDGVDAGVAPQTWTIRTLLNDYTYEVEGADTTVALQSWAISTKLHEYDADPEGVDAGIALQSWNIYERLVAYDYDIEGVDAGIALISWTVSTP